MNQNMMWYPYSSPRGCIDAGPESSLDFLLKGFITDIDEIPDDETVDIGFHYYPNIIIDLYVSDETGNNNNDGLSVDSPFDIPIMLNEEEFGELITSGACPLTTILDAEGEDESVIIVSGINIGGVTIKNLAIRNGNGYSLGNKNGGGLYKTTLNDLPFLLFGSKGSTTSSNADKIQILVNGSWQELWLYYDSSNHYDSDNGKWKYGSNWASSSQTEVIPLKGFKYIKCDNKTKGLVINISY